MSSSRIRSSSFPQAQGLPSRCWSAADQRLFHLQPCALIYRFRFAATTRTCLHKAIMWQRAVRGFSQFRSLPRGESFRRSSPGQSVDDLTVVQGRLNQAKCFSSRGQAHRAARVGTLTDWDWIEPWFEPNAADLFCQLVSRRYEHGSMLITRSPATVWSASGAQYSATPLWRPRSSPVCTTATSSPPAANSYRLRGKRRGLKCQRSQ